MCVCVCARAHKTLTVCSPKTLWQKNIGKLTALHSKSARVKVDGSLRLWQIGHEPSNPLQSFLSPNSNSTKMCSSDTTYEMYHYSSLVFKAGHGWSSNSFCYSCYCSYIQRICNRQNIFVALNFLRAAKLHMYCLFML